MTLPEGNFADPIFISKGLKLGVPYHVGIAVNNIDKAIERYSDLFGMNKWRGRDPEPVSPPEWHGERIPRGGALRWAYSNTEFPWVAFIQPVGDVDWMVPKFLRERGEGIHHIGYFVDDMEETLRQLERTGVTALPPGPPPPAENGDAPERPRGGVVYLDEKTTHGVCIELVPIQLRETLVNYVRTGEWVSADGRTPGKPHEYVLR